MLIKPVEKDQEPKSTRWKALKGSSAFSLAMKQQSVAVGCFVIYFLSQTKENLAGFILSRKKIKSSVIRNKIKRTVHETIRLINAKNKHWIVVRARSSIDSAKFDSDRQKLINTLIKVIK